MDGRNTGSGYNFGGGAGQSHYQYPTPPHGHLQATSLDVIDVGRVLVEALQDLRVLREQLGPRGSLYTGNVEANQAMDDLDLAEARLQDKLQKFMANVPVNLLADSPSLTGPDPATGSFVVTRPRRSNLLASTRRKAAAAAAAREAGGGQRERVMWGGGGGRGPQALLTDPTGQVARNFLRDALASSSAPPAPPGPDMTVRGARGMRKALGGEGGVKEEEEAEIGTRAAAGYRKKRRDALRTSQRHALYYKLLGEIDARTDLHQYQKEAMRSAVLLGRMTTPDILASLQMPAVFEKMAMSYYKDATGFESDDSEEGGSGEGPGAGRRRRVSLVTIDFEAESASLPHPPQSSKPGSTRGSESGAHRERSSSPNRERVGSPGGHYGRSSIAEDEGEGEGVGALPPHVKDLRTGQRRKLTILQAEDPSTGAPLSRRPSFGPVTAGDFSRSTSLFLKKGGVGDLASGTATPFTGGMGLSGVGGTAAGGEDGMLSSAPILSRRRDAAPKPVYNIPAVVLKRKELLDKLVEKEQHRVEEELQRGAEESRLLHVDSGVLRDDLGLQFFHREHVLHWKALVVLLLEIEEWGRRLEVKHVVVDSQLLVKVAEKSIFRNRPPSADDLLVCIANLEEIERELRIPGWRFRGPQGKETAAKWIQKTFRGYLVRRALSVWHKAASMIQKKWRLATIRRKTQQLIEEMRSRRQAAFDRIQSKFRQEWQTWVNVNHVVIHLPSVYFRREEARAGWAHREARENAQMARLCDLMDANADVVYVAPFPVSEEVDTYWNKILQVGGVDRSGLRYRIICPENFSRLPDHFSLTKKLLLSPKSLLRIKMFVGSRPAFIVPWRVGREEIDLAVALGIPLFSPQPKVVDRFTRKTKVREFLSNTKVNMPQGVELPSSLTRPRGAQMEAMPSMAEVGGGEGGAGGTKSDGAPRPSVAAPSTQLRLSEFSRIQPKTSTRDMSAAGDAEPSGSRGPSSRSLGPGPGMDPAGVQGAATGVSRNASRLANVTTASASVSQGSLAVGEGGGEGSEEGGRGSGGAASASVSGRQGSRADMLRSEVSRASGLSEAGPAVRKSDAASLGRTASVASGATGGAARPSGGAGSSASKPPAAASRSAFFTLGMGPVERGERPGSAGSMEDFHSSDDPREDLRARYPMMPGSTILAYELAMLVVQYTQVERWIFKLDDEINGRGFAHIDVGSNETLQRTLHRIHIDPVAVATRTIDMFAVRTLAEALDRLLPRYAVIASPELFETWDVFAEAFARRGGIIEASAALIVGSPLASLVILPNGEVRVLATHELIFCPAYRSIGSYFPQVSVPHGALADAASAVASALYREGVIGHVSVSFVAMRDTGMLRLWVIDIDMGIRSPANAFRLFDYLAAGEFNPRSGAYLITDDDHEEEDEGGRIMNKNHPLFDKQSAQHMQRRYFVTIDLLDVRGISTMPYAEFFSRCRAEGICYDMGNRSGTAFNVVDSFSTGVIGVITVGKTPVDAFLEMKNVLEFVAAASKALRRKQPPAQLSRRTWALAHGSAPKSAEEEAQAELEAAQVQAVIRYLAERVADMPNPG